MSDLARSVVVEELASEIEARIKSGSALPEKREAMETILGRAVALGKEHSTSPGDLASYFAEACIKKNVHASEDAWFDHDLRYAELTFDGVKCTWGKL